jgi:hypothetical protein
LKAVDLNREVRQVALKGGLFFMADDMEKDKQQGGQSGQQGNQSGRPDQYGEKGKGSQHSGQPGQKKKGGQGQNEEDENADRQRRAS